MENAAYGVIVSPSRIKSRLKRLERVCPEQGRHRMLRKEYDAAHGPRLGQAMERAVVSAMQHRDMCVYFNETLDMRYKLDVVLYALTQRRRISVLGIGLTLATYNEKKIERFRRAPRLPYRQDKTSIDRLYLQFGLGYSPVEVAAAIEEFALNRDYDSFGHTTYANLMSTMVDDAPMPVVVPFEGSPTRLRL